MVPKTVTRTTGYLVKLNMDPKFSKKGLKWTIWYHEGTSLRNCNLNFKKFLIDIQTCNLQYIDFWEVNPIYIHSWVYLNLEYIVSIQIWGKNFFNKNVYQLTHRFSVQLFLAVSSVWCKMEWYLTKLGVGWMNFAWCPRRWPEQQDPMQSWWKNDMKSLRGIQDGDPNNRMSCKVDEIKWDEWTMNAPTL